MFMSLECQQPQLAPFLNLLIHLTTHTQPLASAKGTVPTHSVKRDLVTKNVCTFIARDSSFQQSHSAIYTSFSYRTGVC